MILIRFFKGLFLYLFTVSDEIKEKESVPHDIRLQIVYKTVLVIVILVILFTLFNDVILHGFSLKGFFGGLIMLLLLRIYGKEQTDHIIFTLFHKKAYMTSYKTVEELKLIERKDKVKKLKKKIKHGKNYKIFSVTRTH